MKEKEKNIIHINYSLKHMMTRIQMGKKLIGFEEFLPPMEPNIIVAISLPFRYKLKFKKRMKLM